MASGVLVNVALLALIPGRGATGAALALLGGYVAYSVTVGVLLTRTVLSAPASAEAAPPGRADAALPGPP